MGTENLGAMQRLPILIFFFFLERVHVSGRGGAHVEGEGGRRLSSRLPSLLSTEPMVAGSLDSEILT